MRSAGLPPQNTIRSARFLISPRLQVFSPTPSKAMPDGPWHTEVVVLMLPPTSEIATASRCASEVVSLSP